MKITIEAEEGDVDIEPYPVTLVNVKEFIIVGHAADPAGQRTQFQQLRRNADSVSLRSLAWSAIEYLRESARASWLAAALAPKPTKDVDDGGDGPN